jgi:hypothetical protein
MKTIPALTMDKTTAAARATTRIVTAPLMFLLRDERNTTIAINPKNKIQATAANILIMLATFI